jgi:hypothetical protein
MESTELFDLYFFDNIHNIIDNLVDTNISHSFLINRDNKINLYDFIKDNCNLEETINLYEDTLFKNVDCESEEDSENEYL